MKSNERKIAAVMMSIVLVVALIISAVFNVLMTRQLYAADTVFATDDTAVASNCIEVEVQSSPLMAMAASETVAVAAASDIYKITVTPDVSLPDTLIDWTITFKDAASTWATGKTVTDYAIITPTSNGALTANLSILQAFAEQIIVTASLRGNTAIKAVCKVDYKAKYTRTNTIVNTTGYADFKSVYTETSVGSLPSTDHFNIEISNAGYGANYQGLIAELWQDIDFLQYIERKASAIDIDFCMSIFDQYDVGNGFHKINSSTDLTKQSGTVRFPLFNAVYLIDEDEKKLYNGYIGGFYTENAKYKEDCELMMCRFLGLYPNLSTTDNPLEWEFDYYKNRLSKAGILDQISAFKTAFNAFVDKKLSEETILLADEMAYLGVGFTDAHNFNYIYKQPMYSIETYREYPLFWAFNKFTLL